MHLLNFRFTPASEKNKFLLNGKLFQILEEPGAETDQFDSLIPTVVRPPDSLSALLSDQFDLSVPFHQVTLTFDLFFDLDPLKS